IPSAFLAFRPLDCGHVPIQVVSTGVRGQRPPSPCRKRQTQKTDQEILAAAEIICCPRFLAAIQAGASVPEAAPLLQICAPPMEVMRLAADVLDVPLQELLIPDD